MSNAMSNATLQPLFDSLMRLRKVWPKRGWSWDTRLSCVASSFDVDMIEEAQQAIKVAFPHEWGKVNILSAPPIIRDIAERSGGVRSDQRLLATNPVGRLIAYGMWWPWGDEITISLRIGLAGTGATEHEDRLREVFDALQ